MVELSNGMEARIFDGGRVVLEVGSQSVVSGGFHSILDLDKYDNNDEPKTPERIGWGERIYRRSIKCDMSIILCHVPFNNLGALNDKHAV
jgi:hypothetical protein